MGNETAILDRAAAPYRHLLTVDEFLILDEAGAFRDLGRVELIEGEIFVMAPLYRPHAKAVWELTVAVGRAVEELAGIEGLSPVSAKPNPNSLPEADIVLASVADDKVVTPETVRLMIEVADSSLSHDLGPKLRLYARAAVPEYWVADVNGHEIIRFHAPRDERYTERAVFAFGEPVVAATIPGLTVDTGRLAG